MQLVFPSDEYLASYVRALEQGWSPDTLRPEAGQEELAAIRLDPADFLRHQLDRDPRGRTIILPDGSEVPRLPGYRKWMWDGEFCGVIGFRWQPGTAELPPYCPGHIGFSVVPWKRRKGYATRALQMLLPEAKAEGLPYVELTTAADNVGSQRVIQKNGGRLVERFFKQATHAGAESLRFLIPLE